MQFSRNDRHDTDRRELKLIRVGHCLWALYKKECGKSGNVEQEQRLYEALQTVWRLKVELRKDLKAERAAKSEIMRERFRERLHAAA